MTHFSLFKLSRYLLGAFAVLGTLFANQVAFAQTPSGERVALVIGNAAYSSAPLTNPSNDAKAMAGLLRSAGFDVHQQINASLEQLQTEVKEFGKRIQDPKVKFAVFYYAGHGVQLDWRNYLVPVSANIRTADDVRKQAVDVSSLITYMNSAKNRNYLIILDACRDDPFAGNYRAPAAGLSQFDAPTGSVLAYSTSPGKVAFDGDGENGLYTSYLLKEFAVKGVKIEDAFKRTRLNVRMASNGAQIPWETTSLEEDVYLFPDGRKQLSEAEQHALFEREVAHWLRVKSSTSLPVLAEFIKTYPSGSVSELAAARFNRLQADERERAAQEQAAKSAALIAAEKARQEREAAARAAAQQALLAKQEAERQAIESARLEALRVETLRKEAELLIAAKAKAKAEADLQALAREEARRESLRLQAKLEQEKQAAQAEQARLAQQRAFEAEQVAKTQVALAKLAEEREKQIQLTAQAANKTAGALTVVTSPAPLLFTSTPFYSGSTEHHRAYAVGDIYEFQVVDHFTKAAKPLHMKVTALDTANDSVTFNDGEYVSDVMGNILTNLRGSSSTPRQFYPAEMMVGKRWRTQFVQKRANGYQFTFRYDLKVVGKERITVPAGSFDAYKIEARGYNLERGAKLERNIWITPGINADIAHETIVRLSNGQIEQYDRQELVRFAQKAPISYVPVVANR